jgi:hypothetical protein
MTVPRMSIYLLRVIIRPNVKREVTLGSQKDISDLEVLTHISVCVYIYIYMSTRLVRSRGISVGIATGLRAGRPGFDSRQYNICLLSTALRPTLEPTQSPIQWVPEVTFSGDKAAGA